MEYQEQQTEDREMELREHLAELRERVIKALIPYAILIIPIFIESDKIITIIWNRLFYGKEMVVYTPPEYVIARIMISLYISFLITYPWIIYQAYLFVKPALYSHEKKFLKAYLPLSYIFFIIGFMIAYLLILPKIYSAVVIKYLGAKPFLSVRESLYNFIKVTLSIGLSLQMPLITSIAVKFGFISTKWLKEKRLLVYLIVFILITNISLDISGLTQVIVLTAFVIMFELSILISKVFERRENEDSDSRSRRGGI